MKQQKNKDQEDAEEEETKEKKMKKLKDGGLLTALPGFSSYEKPDEKKTKEFIDGMDPRKQGNRMIILLLYIFCFVVNWLSLDRKQSAHYVYLLIKQIESITFWDNSNDKESSGVNFEFNTRADLYRYLTDAFPKRFFNSRNVNDQKQEAERSGKEYIV